jgi:hypothetical protein
MTTLKSVFRWLIVLLLVLGVCVFVVTNYSRVFAKVVHGEILEVERISNPTAILGRASDAQIHSYAILIHGDDGIMYTASSDDRQWQVIKKGYCVDARFYVYPPWDLDKSGTYFNARLLNVHQCPGKDWPKDAPLPVVPPEEPK